MSKTRLDTLEEVVEDLSEGVRQLMIGVVLTMQKLEAAIPDLTAYSAILAKQKGNPGEQAEALFELGELEAARESARKEIQSMFDALTGEDEEDDEDENDEDDEDDEDEDDEEED